MTAPTTTTTTPSHLWTWFIFFSSKTIHFSEPKMVSSLSLCCRHRRCVVVVAVLALWWRHRWHSLVIIVVSSLLLCRRCRLLIFDLVKHCFYSLSLLFKRPYHSPQVNLIFRWYGSPMPTLVKTLSVIINWGATMT